ncbi:protein AF-10-like isoform X2 [Cotesia glomerata]|uniref:protein AF-10-like isoform X2 n=1 Tax=Cotesia glomerata TaxID=32391 RepID=UPI001D02C3DB|nr:protein AF-10-like isoform X2 [Cotesia glomerata]
MKEMLGGCCVCSDERGWTENPLVYCDGQGCTVAVHQACYGIVTVPTGPWYCRKCESQERSARVRCELCPSRDGALKRTDQAGWAHVVCALYIPEVRFGNVTTMEPIILQLIPSERFNKICYICEEQARGSRATVGACMQCNKTGCKQQFHVTCAQALGLLCEEAGNYLDNVKYCGYCQHHYSKLKKGGNVKTIPPYKPIPADNGSSDSSPEKEIDLPSKTSTTVKRKSSNLKSSTTLNLKNKLNTSPSLDVDGVIDEKNGSDRNIPKDATSSSTPGSSKFTTSNFVETVVTQSESVFGHENSSSSTISSDLVSTGGVKPGTNINFTHKNNNHPKSSSSINKLNYSSKKRKTGTHTPTAIGSENSNNSVSSEASGSVVTVSSIIQSIPSNSVQPTVTEATSLSTVSELEKLKLTSDNSLNSNTSNISTTNVSTTTPVIISSPSTQTHTTTTATSIVVSVPLTATSLPNFAQSVVTSAPTLYQQLQRSMSTIAVTNNDQSDSVTYSDHDPPEDSPAKKLRFRLQSTDKQEKVRKTKRGSTLNNPSLSIPPVPVSSISSSTSSTTISIVKTSKRNLARNNSQTQSLSVTPISSIIQGTTTATGNFSSITSATGNTMRSVVKDSPPSSPSSESMSSTGPGRTKKKSVEDHDSITPLSSINMTPTPLASNTKEEKEVKLFQNGVNAPHMLGNQLNPSSTMAQKMSDTLHQELEAHSIFTEASNSSTTLVGPQLHSRVIASIRSNQFTTQPQTSFASVFQTNNVASTNISSSGALSGSAIPQTLDQLLERQWEQGSQFLMEQAQHFDIASLLSCLHQLRAENLRLEEHVNSLLQRRDHLLAVNARLAIPLTTQPNTHSRGTQSHQNTTHSDLAIGQSASISRVNRDARVNNIYLPHSNSTGNSSILENGLSSDSSSPAAGSVSQYTHRGQMVAPQPSPTMRHSPASSVYHQGQSSNIVSPANSSNTGTVRNSSAPSEPLRGITR